MTEEISVREWQGHFINGDFDKPDVKSQIKAGWYDWFCRETSLVGKTRSMGSIVKKVKDGGKVNLDTMYVWFKNNCPMSGGLYDDFRFADIETGTTMMTIRMNCCWDTKRYTVFARRSVDSEMECETPAFESDSQKELVAWLNTPWEEMK